MKEKLRSLEGLRAVAALLVVMFHTETIFSTSGHVPFAGLFGAGNHGVDLFFVLSGFVIAFVHGPDLGQPRRLGRYLYNRVTRIYPAVWIMTSFALATYLIGFGGAAKLAKLDPYAIVASYLLLAQKSAPLVNVSWTLTYEIFFYAVFAIAIINRRIGLTVLILWQMAALVGVFWHVSSPILAYYQRPICLEFSLGLGCAWAAYRWRLVPAALSWSMLALGLVCFVFGLAPSVVGLAAAPLCAVGAATMIFALVQLERRGRMLVPGPLVWLGGASYAVYMVHYSVITLLAAVLLRHFHVFASTPLCLVCAVIGASAGVVFHVLIDRPIQRLCRRARPGRAEAQALAPASAGVR